jgi:hypothetical protein
MGKIFANYSLDEGKSRIYKEFKILNIKRTKYPINKWVNEQFSKEV